MRIVFVCTTNVWGSAMAELISRQLLAELDPNREQVEVYSVGVRAEVGAPMPAVAQRVLAERGIDASGHRARWMSPAVLAGADLTLTMGAIQREAALALNPRGLRGTFTIHEAFALLSGAAGHVEPTNGGVDEHSRSPVLRMAAARRYRSVVRGGDDLPDLVATEERAVRALRDDLSRDLNGVLSGLTVPTLIHSGSQPTGAATDVPLIQAVA